MISLDEDKQYFILIDGEGYSFGGGRIFEGIEEVAEQFQDWANADDFEDPTLNGWPISECLETWDMDIKVYNGNDFMEVDPIYHKDVYNFIIK